MRLRGGSRTRSRPRAARSRRGPPKASPPAGAATWSSRPQDRSGCRPTQADRPARPLCYASIPAPRRWSARLSSISDESGGGNTSSEWAGEPRRQGPGHCCSPGTILDEESVLSSIPLHALVADLGQRRGAWPRDPDGRHDADVPPSAALAALAHTHLCGRVLAAWHDAVSGWLKVKKPRRLEDAIEPEEISPRRDAPPVISR